MMIFVILGYVKNRLIYYPSRAPNWKYNKFYRKLLSMTQDPIDVVNIMVPSTSGVLLDTFYVKNREKSKCIILFHGNAGNLTMRYDIISLIYNYASVVIFDYRSYGKSSRGDTMLSETVLMKDSRAIWNFVTQRLGYHANEICLMGESLGCAVAIKLAANLSLTLDPLMYPHSLILNSPFYSLKGMINRLTNNIKLSSLSGILGFIYGHDYDMRSTIPYLNCLTKIVVAHSPRDEVIPYRQALELYHHMKKLRLNAEFISLMGTHNNLCMTAQYMYTLTDILDSNDT